MSLVGVGVWCNDGFERARLHMYRFEMAKKNERKNSFAVFKLFPRPKPADSLHSARIFFLN